MKQELFNFLDSKHKKINQEYTNRIIDLKNYFENFFQNYPQNDINIIANMPEKEIILPLIILSNPLKLQEILKALEKYPNIFKNNEYTHLFGALTLYYNKEEVRNLVAKCESLNPLIYIPATIDLGSILVMSGLKPSECDIPSFFKDNPNAKKDLEIVFKDFSSEFHNNGGYLIDGIRRYNESDEFEDKQAFLDFLPRERKRKYKKIVGVTNKKEFLLKRIRTYYTFLNTKLQAIIKNFEKKQNEVTKYNQNIDEIKELLNTDKEIKNIDNIIKLCATDDIKEVVIDYIIAHNKKLYEELIKNYEHARHNSDENLSNLFKKYGFNYDILSYSDKINLKKQDFIEIEKLLKRLSVIKVYNINVSQVSLNKLLKIEELIQKGVITGKWLQDNSTLLLSTNEELDLVISNINILSKEGINMLKYSNSLDITKSPILKHNLYLLRLYNLAIAKEDFDINFLSATDLRFKIEFVYSLGIHQELTDLNILNYSLEELLRIKIANLLNIPTQSITDLTDIFVDFTQNYIPEEIFQKLCEDSTLNTDIPLYIKQFYNDNQTLNINGVYVSIEKVKRNIAKIGNNDAKSCFYAIIYNGYYTYLEIERLKQALIPEQTLFKR